MDGIGAPLAADRTMLTTQCVKYDALVVAGGSADTGRAGGYVSVNLTEAFRHLMVLGAWGVGAAVLEANGIAADQPGLVAADAADAGFAGRLVEAIVSQRHWDR